MSKDSELGKAFEAWSEEGKRMAEESLPAFNEQFKNMGEGFTQCSSISQEGQRCVLRLGHDRNFDSSVFNGYSHDYGVSNIR